MKTRVRMYNVGFGDCFLVTFDGPKREHHMLIDCGRLSGSRTVDDGGADFELVVREMLDSLGPSRRLDVIVMTHRHRDHVHGFSYAQLWKDVTVGEVWMPWVEDPVDPTASGIVERQNRMATTALFGLRALRADGDAAADEAIEIAYNSTTNAAAMATLRNFDGARMRYLPDLGRDPQTLSGSELRAVLPDGIKIHVLGPSRDPRVIKRLDPPEDKVYHRLLPADTEIDPDSIEGDRIDTAPKPFHERWQTDGTRYGLSDVDIEDIRQQAAQASLSPLELTYRIDNAINGTSLVLVIEVGKHKLLFSGDAQWGTWEAILGNDDARRILQGITMFKVGHHGSHNATPKELVEGGFLAARKQALISVDSTTHRGGWQFIPLPSLVDNLAKRMTVVQSNRAGVTPTKAKIAPREPPMR